MEVSTEDEAVQIICISQEKKKGAICKTAFKAHAEHSDFIIKQDKAELSKSTEHASNTRFFQEWNRLLGYRRRR